MRKFGALMLMSVLAMCLVGCGGSPAPKAPPVPSKDMPAAPDAPKTEAPKTEEPKKDAPK